MNKVKLKNFIVLPRDFRVLHMNLLRLGGVALIPLLGGRVGEENCHSHLQTLSYSFLKYSFA